MFAHVTRLCHWKSEYTQATCQDASAWDIKRGLFAIADGVSTAILSDLWANILVEHALRVPLLSTDPFEVEWWLRLAQETFKNRMPDPATLSWNVQRKVYTQGSYSTMATLRVSAVTSHHAQVSLLAFGDSCIFIARRPYHRLVCSFPLQHPADFTVMPISLPSLSGSFQRGFHRCAERTVTLQHGDIVILATDAVAQWIMNADYEQNQQGKATSTRAVRIRMLLEQTPQSWPYFVTKLRERQQIVDDDSTALIITLQNDSRLHRSHKSNLSPFPHTQVSRHRFKRNLYYQKLGSTTVHNQDVLARRKDDYDRAKSIRNRAAQAVIVGDARDLRSQGVELPDTYIAYIRGIADAMSDALSTLQQALNAREPLTLLLPMWERCSPVLQDEPCAAGLRDSLRSLGLTIATTREPAFSATYTDEKGGGNNE